MPQSALLGQEPLTENDRLIAKGLRIVSPSPLNPDKRYPLGPPLPPNAPHGSRAPGMIIGQSFAVVLVIVITLSRLCIRRKIKAFGLDDWAMIPAAIGALCYFSVNIASETAGCLGSHIWDCTYGQIGWFVELAQLAFPIFYWTVFWAKISIVLQNRRITGISSKRWQIVHYCYLGLLVPTGVICVCLHIFACRPIAVQFSLQAVAKMKNRSIFQCLDMTMMSLATRITHIVTDWLLVPVPIIITFRLKMRLSQRLRLLFLFSLGVLSSIASIVRNITLLKPSVDSTYDPLAIYDWNIVDIFFTVIVPSLPALNPFAEHVAKSLHSLVSSNRTKTDSGASMSKPGLSRFSIKDQRKSHTDGTADLGTGPREQHSLESINPLIRRQVDVEMQSYPVKDAEQLPSHQWHIVPQPPQRSQSGNGKS